MIENKKILFLAIRNLNEKEIKSILDSARKPNGVAIAMTCDEELLFSDVKIFEKVVKFSCDSIKETVLNGNSLTVAKKTLFQKIKNFFMKWW